MRKTHSDEPDIEVRRSTKRRKTVSAYRDGDTIVIMLPAHMSIEQEKQWVERMRGQLKHRDVRKQLRTSDSMLLNRAQYLANHYLGGGFSVKVIRWVSNQSHRWGSCTPANGEIRLSVRLRNLPEWVVDYVIIHELAHLKIPNHGPEFARIVDLYPLAERAKGFLEGYETGIKIQEKELVTT